MPYACTQSGMYNIIMLHIDNSIIIIVYTHNLTLHGYHKSQYYNNNKLIIIVNINIKIINNIGGK